MGSVSSLGERRVSRRERRVRWILLGAGLGGGCRAMRFGRGEQVCSDSVRVLTFSRTKRLKELLISPKGQLPVRPGEMHAVSSLSLVSADKTYARTSGRSVWSHSSSLDPSISSTYSCTQLIVQRVRHRKECFSLTVSNQGSKWLSTVT
jgi:hypothetical protein